jgi:hypothetical protein
MAQGDSVKSWLQRRLVRPVIALLLQGITPEKVALSLVFGVMLGIFPVLGSTTLLCAVAALVFRLNLPAIQLVNYLVYPLQLAFVVPFMRLGARLFGHNPIVLSLEQMLALFRADAGKAFHLLWLVGLQAVGAWFLIVPPLAVALYLVLARVLRRAAAGLRAQTPVLEG